MEGGGVIGERGGIIPLGKGGIPFRQHTGCGGLRFGSLLLRRRVIRLLLLHGLIQTLQSSDGAVPAFGEVDAPGQKLGGGILLLRLIVLKVRHQGVTKGNQVIHRDILTCLLQAVLDIVQAEIISIAGSVLRIEIVTLRIPVLPIVEVSVTGNDALDQLHIVGRIVLDLLIFQLIGEIQRVLALGLGPGIVVGLNILYRVIEALLHSRNILLPVVMHDQQHNGQNHQYQKNGDSNHQNFADLPLPIRVNKDLVEEDGGEGVLLQTLRLAGEQHILHRVHNRLRLVRGLRKYVL